MCAPNSLQENTLKKYRYVLLPIPVRSSTPSLLQKNINQSSSETRDGPDHLGWRQLSMSRDSKDREAVAMETLSRTSKDSIEIIKAQLEQERYVICVDARKSSDVFWQLNEKMRETGDPKLQGYFGTRARGANGWLDISWYKNRFVTNKATGKTRVLSDHIKKGEGFRYPEGAFRSAKPWEKEPIKKVEDRYALLRERSAALTEIHRAVAKYERLLERHFSEA